MDERRELNAKLLVHMGRVDQHMENDAIFKHNYLKVVERVGKVENRVTKVETKQGYMAKTGYFAIATMVTFFTKGYWVKLLKGV